MERNNLVVSSAASAWPCKFTRKFVIGEMVKRTRPTNASVNGGKYGGLTIPRTTNTQVALCTHLYWYIVYQ